MQMPLERVDCSVGACQRYDDDGFSSTHGVPCESSARRSWMVTRSVWLPKARRRISVSERPGTPQICSAVLGPCPSISRRARLQVEQGVPNQQPQTSLLRIQPNKTEMTAEEHALIPFKISTRTAPKPRRSTHVDTPPFPENTSRNILLLPCFFETSKASLRAAFNRRTLSSAEGKGGSTRCEPRPLPPACCGVATS